MNGENISSRLEDYREHVEDGDFLITGAYGFLGSHMTETLAEMGGRVHALDNGASGRRENIDQAKERGEVIPIDMDVRQVDEEVVTEDLDGIIHAASRAAPDDYQDNMVETLRTNSQGTHNVLEIAREHDAPLLFTSTSEVYGDPPEEEIPTEEDFWGHVNPIGVRSCYDEGKRFGEALCKAHQREHGTDVRIARIFNTFGPRIRPDGLYGRALPKFIHQAERGEDVTVYGDGSQTRSFAYVSDTVDGLMRTFLDDRAEGEVFNVGNDEEITILNLAETIRDVTDSDSDITFHPLPEDDPMRRHPDLTKIRKELDYEPQVGLEEGLNKTVQWYREEYA